MRNHTFTLGQYLRAVSFGKLQFLSLTMLLVGVPEVCVSNLKFWCLAVRPSHTINAMAQARRSMHGYIHGKRQSANEANR